MSWIDALCVILFFALAFGVIIFLWYLEKPERELRKKRLAAEWSFYHSAAYVFDHIARNIDSYDAAFFNIESSLISISQSLSTKEEQ